MGNYRRLLAWQAAHELALEVFRATAEWAPSERYGLTAQVRRAAFSIPANIAEGNMRLGPREARRFFDIAWGSLAELEYALELAEALGIARPEHSSRLTALAKRTGQLTYRLLRRISPHT
jgi:four helix bundle protein